MSRRKRTLPQDMDFIGLFIRSTIIKLSSSSGSSEIVGAEIHINEKDLNVHLPVHVLLREDCNSLSSLRLPI